ncbi:hypothetical protein RAB80_012777 [Fusarium oxysporum f. sp. vasinfectum]|nr:hypothetical protein RAB80_012777 [Fusarium oxysporum f. sp. vasinfectum]
MEGFYQGTDSGAAACLGSTLWKKPVVIERRSGPKPDAPSALCILSPIPYHLL